MVTAAGGPRTRGFNCGNCGGAVELRALSHAVSVTCTTCGALLDPRDPNLVVLQQARLRESILPKIPLGTRGTWHGQPYQVIGFQQRSITVEGVRYAWDEYVLFNPYRGFRYLTDYQGHWNDVHVVREVPEVDTSASRPKVTHGGRTYKHFQHAEATTDYVIGEFPWRVTVGDLVKTDDYIDPPYMLSSEGTLAERTWSFGEYTPAATIWKAFDLPGSPARPTGVFANQPNPHNGAAAAGCTVFFLLLGLLILLMGWRMVSADRERVFSQQYTWQPGAAEQAFVTAPFTLSDSGTLQIDLSASVDNNWLGLDLALINLDTGTAYNVDQSLEFFSGVEGGESWTEGSRQTGVFLREVPAGQYYLRVEPEGPSATQAAVGTTPVSIVPIGYAITVTRDVPSYLPYLLAMLVLLLLPLLAGWRSLSFEARRDAEGDYGSSSSSDDDDDDED